MWVWVSGHYSGDSDITRLHFRVNRDGYSTDFCDEFVSFVINTGSDSYCNIGMWVSEDTGPYTYDVDVEVNTSSGLGSENWVWVVGWQTHRDHDHSGSGMNAELHDHSASGLSADNHDHPNGDYDINAADLDNISIGDGASEAEGINATEVSIYLERYEGGDWVEHHSILGTDVTIDTDVDLTDGGTYPDDTGYWRVRIVTDSASADFVQGQIKLKHSMDN
jgi:hypothetical protein